MQIRTILYQYIKTLIKHVFLLNFTYELLMRFRKCIHCSFHRFCDDESSRGFATVFNYRPAT